LGNQPFGVNILLDGQNNLLGIYRFNQIVRNFASQRLIHDILLLALGNHHHRGGGRKVFYPLQSLQSGYSRHIFIQKDQVKVIFLHQGQGISSIGRCCHLIVPLFQEKDIRFQKVNFIICP